MHDDPTRFTGPQGDEPGVAADDWYRASHHDQVHDGLPADQLNDGYGTPAGYPGVGPSAQWSYGASPATPPQYAPQPQAPQKRRGWVAPVALGVVALVSFGAVTAVMSKDSSPKQAVAPAVSNSVSQSAAPASTPSSTSSTGPSSNTVTVTTTAPAAVPTASTEQSTATETTASSSSTSQTAAMFPPGVLGTCFPVAQGEKTKIAIPDTDIDQKKNNSCEFLHSVKNKVREEEAKSSETDFDLQVYSVYREKLDKPDKTVPLSCHRSGGLTNCIHTSEPQVDIWVRDAS